MPSRMPAGPETDLFPGKEYPANMRASASSTLAKGLLGVSLTAMHYVDNMAPNATLTTGLSALVYLAPAACFVLAAVPLLFYRLRPAQIESIRQDLETRRSAEK